MEGLEEKIRQLEFEKKEFKQKVFNINEDLLDQFRDIIQNRVEFIKIKNSIGNLEDFVTVSTIIDLIRTTVNNKVENLERTQEDLQEYIFSLKQKISYLEGRLVTEGSPQPSGDFDNLDFLKEELLSLKEENKRIVNLLESKNTKTLVKNMALEYSKIIFRMVPIFSGETSQNDVYIFLSNCKAARQCAGEMTAAQQKEFVGLLMTRLVGRAFATLQCKEYSNLNEFERDVKKYFLPTKTLDEMITEIKNTSQLPMEDVLAYGNRLRQIAEKTKVGLAQLFGENERVGLKFHIDQTAIDTFKTKLANPVLRQHMIGSSEATLNGLIEAARRVETLAKGTEATTSTTDINSSKQTELLSKLLEKMIVNENKQAEPTNILFGKSFAHPGDFDRRPHNYNKNRYDNNRNNRYDQNFLGRQFYNDNRNRNYNRDDNPFRKKFPGNGSIRNSDNQRDQFRFNNSRQREYCEWCARLGHLEEKCRIKVEYFERSDSKNQRKGQSGSAAPQ